MTSDSTAGRSVHEISRFRDEVKTASGLAAALDALERLWRVGSREDDAVVINIAICLFESNRFEEAAELLFPFLVQGRHVGAFHDFAPNAVEIALCSMVRCGREADALRLLESLIAGNDRSGLKRLLGFVARLETSEAAFAAAWRCILASGIEIEIDGSTMTHLWGRCSALSLPDLADAIEARIGRRTHEFELAARVRRLIHRSADGECWQRFVDDLDLAGQIDPYDGYRIGLNLLGSGLGDATIPTMHRLADASPGCWALRRLIGVAYERQGRREQAAELYRRAAAEELRSRDLDVEAFPSRDARDVRISCIAISYNDEPLVRHFCNMVMAHCDEIVVNDGGSSDGTVEAFERFGAEHDFPVVVMRDRQHRNRARSLSTKDSYRKSGWGGVIGFDADRRRTLTLIEAKYEYILMLDLDDYLPPFINLKSLVAASYGIDHICGARLEVLGNGRYTTLRLGAEQAAPTLFRRDRHHVYAGVDSDDEYLAFADRDLAKWAMKGCRSFLSDGFCYWHLKYCLDGSSLHQVRASMGPDYDLMARYDRPLLSTLSHIASLA